MEKEPRESKENREERTSGVYREQIEEITSGK
jgi:hypothetical protein